MDNMQCVWEVFQRKNPWRLPPWMGGPDTYHRRILADLLVKLFCKHRILQMKPTIQTKPLRVGGH